MVEDGLTLTVIAGADPLNTVPSDNVPEIVPDPVAVMVSVAEPPLHMVVVPLKAPVGLALTVTTALPVLSAPIDAQVPLVKVAMV